MIFSNSLLRLKANKHLFHYLIKFPNLDVEGLLYRNDIQLRIANGIDHTQSFIISDRENDNENKLEKEDLRTKHKLCIPIIKNSKIFSISTTLTGPIEAREKNDPKTFLGKGGFGEVRACSFAGTNAAMKKFLKFNKKNEGTNSNKQHKNRDRKGKETREKEAKDKKTKGDIHNKTQEIKEREEADREDYIREFRANININAKYFPKFYGTCYIKDGENNPVLITSQVSGMKLSQCYQDIIEDYPEIIPQILLEISSAISFVHDRNIFHGDISTNNVIIDHKPETEELSVYLIDFGLSGSLTNGKICGHTIDFTPYECLISKTTKNLSKIDIFSFGSIMFFIYFRISFASYLVKFKPPSNVLKTGKIS